jgi:hypothetical protein
VILLHLGLLLVQWLEKAEQQAHFRSAENAMLGGSVPLVAQRNLKHDE